LGYIDAPIFEQEGSVVTVAISISGAPHRVLGVRIEGLAEELLKTNAKISVCSGGTASPGLAGIHKAPYPLYLHRHFISVLHIYGRIAEDANT